MSEELESLRPGERRLRNVRRRLHLKGEFALTLVALERAALWIPARYARP